MVHFNLHFKPLFVVEQCLIVTLLLLDISTHISELRLQLPNDRAQVLKLNIMPVLCIIQGVLQASFL